MIHTHSISTAEEMGDVEEHENTPEQNLWIAVFSSAVKDYRKGPALDPTTEFGHKKQQRFESAKRLLECTPGTLAFDVSESIGLDLGAVREILRIPEQEGS